MANADELWGHNIINFDLPLIRKLFPSFRLKEGVKVRDSIICSRLIWTDLKNSDHKLINKKGLFPPRLIGKQSLEAWGFRLGVLKGNFKDTSDFTKWTPEMQAYCVQDVVVTEKLIKLILAQGYSEEAIQLEHDVAEIIAEMTRFGVAFDEEAAGKLYASLVAQRQEIEAELQKVFPPLAVEYTTPKKGIKKTKTVVFNPGSRKQIADRLKGLGWVPTKFTPTGDPAIDDEVLRDIDIPEAKPLSDYFALDKLIGQLAEGNKSWMKASKKGRIHGEITTNGAVTGRGIHHDPNLGQVPSVEVDEKGNIKYGRAGGWGAECRSLFVCSPGTSLVGADASGLELRCLAHYFAPYDGGDYAREVVSGDVHSKNQAAFGLPAGKQYRNERAKPGMYSKLYGAANEKHGRTLIGLAEEHEAAAQALPISPAVAKELGNETRIKNWKRGAYAGERLRAQIPAYAKLVDDIATVVAGPITGYRTGKDGRKWPIRKGGRGYLKGLDGRRLHIRSLHAALNTLLQSAGALLVKKAIVLWYKKLLSLGLKSGVDFKLVLWVHDEIQAEARPEIAELIGKTFVEALQDAGASWKFKCELTGSMAVGKSWKETH